MKRCPIENTWHPNEYRFCPDCGTELERNEMSSEDADDGIFTEPNTCARCKCVLTAVNSAPALINETLEWELLCRECFDIVVDEHIDTRRQERKDRRKELVRNAIAKKVSK